MTAKEHNKMVGIFLAAHGGLQAIVLLLISLVYGIVGGALVAGGGKQEDRFVGAVFIGLVFVLVLVVLAFVLPQIIGGFKMIRERPNARMWGIVGSIISCLSFPLGTAAGVYGLWFLFGDEGKRFYLGGAHQQPMIENPTVPPPNSWQ